MCSACIVQCSAVALGSEFVLLKFAAAAAGHILSNAVHILSVAPFSFLNMLEVSNKNVVGRIVAAVYGLLGLVSGCDCGVANLCVFVRLNVLCCYRVQCSFEV